MAALFTRLYGAVSKKARQFHNYPIFWFRRVVLILSQLQKCSSNVSQMASKSLSGGFSLGWAKAGMTTIRDPDQKGMIGTLYPSALHIPKGFGLGPLMAEIWAFFQIDRCPRQALEDPSGVTAGGVCFSLWFQKISFCKTNRKVSILGLQA